MARSFCLLAAAAAGVPAFDHHRPPSSETCRSGAPRPCVRRQGFVGKLAIHPAQVAPIHGRVPATVEEIAWAERVVAAFGASPGRGLLHRGRACSTGRTCGRPERILAAAAHG